jgi:CRISPR system Cascade subunit CasE
VNIFLTQIVVNKTQAATHRLSDAYAWHNALWKCFPEKENEKRHFLFRLDELPRDMKVLMLSSDKPEILYWGNWQTKSIPPSFLSHPVYRFQIKANPTMLRLKDRRRIGIYNEERLCEWLVRKGSQNGFSIEQDSLQINGPMDETFTRKGKIGKHTWADFKGILNVTDNDAFNRGFYNGIGSAKSFGYGMLMLEPAGKYSI